MEESWRRSGKPSGQVKIKRNKVETAAPANLEELRAKVVLMANHYLFAKFRYPNKQSLQKINPFTFLDYLGYLTGKHVSQLESLTVDGVMLHKPSVKLLINYEYQMRKEVTDEINQGGCMAEALSQGVKNSDIRERHFSTPLAVSSAVQATQGLKEKHGDRWQPYDPPKGKGKGKKGKGKKGKGKQQEMLHSTSPDGRQICYAWNNKKEGCKGGCQRLHVCRICLDPKHPTYEHPSKEEEKKQEWLGAEPVSPPSSKKKVLYLFAGKDRRTSIRSVLERFSKNFGGQEVECEEWDICRGPDNDLLDEETQRSLLQRIESGEFFAVLLSPPCASWSRAPWANRWGPRPLRTALHPWGLPWLEGSKLSKVASSNAMIRLCLQVLEKAIAKGLGVFLEHPENLGSVRSRPSATVRPASIWELPEIQGLQGGDVFTVAFYVDLGHRPASPPESSPILEGCSLGDGLLGPVSIERGAI